MMLNRDGQNKLCVNTFCCLRDSLGVKFNLGIAYEELYLVKAVISDTATCCCLDSVSILSLDHLVDYIIITDYREFGPNSPWKSAAMLLIWMVDSLSK